MVENRPKKPKSYCDDAIKAIEISRYFRDNGMKITWIMHYLSYKNLI
jgi:hypothetical protein